MLLQGSFAKVDDFKSGDIITILSEPIYTTSKFTNEKGELKQQLTCEIKMPNGLTKTLSVNATNRELLKEAFGKETTNWIDKKAAVDITLITMGQMRGKKSLLLTPIIEKI